MANRDRRANLAGCGRVYSCHLDIATETGLAGWGHETRTTESISTEIRLSCRGILPDLAQGIVQRRFQCELRVGEPAAAAGRLADRVHRREYQGRSEDSAHRPRKQLEPAQVSARLPLSTEQCIGQRTPSPPGSLLSPASAARPPRGFGGGGALCAGTWRGA